LLEEFIEIIKLCQYLFSDQLPINFLVVISKKFLKSAIMAELNVKSSVNTLFSPSMIKASALDWRASDS
jgi:hypothetical protein